MTFIETLDILLENENSPNTPIIICDFNIDIESKNLMVDTYLNSIAANCFEFYPVQFKFNIRKTTTHNEKVYRVSKLGASKKMSMT